MNKKPVEVTRSGERIQLEICAGSYEDCITAQQGGADRIELNACLEVGGLTPSAGTLRLAVENSSIPIIVMIRPRPGGFCYSKADYESMRRDADLAKEWDAAGIAFGILTEKGEVDLDRCHRLIRTVEPIQNLVFHRAFDFIRTSSVALEQIINLGFTRVLTSGRKQTALSGCKKIQALQNQSSGRIEILPAGGINPENVAQIIHRTGCLQVHGSLSELARDPSMSEQSQIHLANLSDSADRYRRTSMERVSFMRKTLDGLIKPSGKVAV